MHIHRRGEVNPLYIGVKLSSGKPEFTIQTGDLVAAVSGVAVPAHEFTWDTNEATTQTNFAAAFLGMSNSRSRAATDDLRDLEIGVTTGGEIEMDCVSGAYPVGTLVGCDSAASKLKQTVKEVPTKARAIGVVWQAAPANSTRVIVRLLNTPDKR